MKKSLFKNPTGMSSLNNIEHALQEWMEALDVLKDPLFLHDKQFRVLRCNKAYQQCAGIPFKQIIGQPYYAVFPKTGAPLPSCLREEEQAKENVEEVLAGEAIYLSRTFSIKDVQGAYIYSVHTLTDITERKRMETELQQSEARYKRITEGLTDYQYTVRIENGRAVETTQSPACVAVTGYTAQEFTADPYLWIQMVVPEDRDLVREHARQIMSGSNAVPIEHRITRKNGEIRWISDTTILFKDASGKLLSYDGVIKDITERKWAEESLVRIKSELEEAQHLSHIGSWYWDAQTDATTGTDELLHIYGLDPATQSMPAFREQKGWLYPVESWERVNAAVLKTLQTGVGYKLDVKALRADSTAIWITTRSEAVRDAEGQIVGLRGTVQDITERKQAEAEIQHANRALAALSAVNHTLVHTTDENELLQTICDAIVEQKGYRMAWVGYKQHDENKSIKIMAHAGHDEGYLDPMQLTWAETEHGMRPCGHAIRSRATQVCQDIAHNPHYLPWRNAAFQRGYASSIALPLLERDGTVFGTLAVYSGEVNAFTSAEINLLEEMAGDLAFGVRSLHTRQERDLALAKNREQLVQLQDSLEDTVRAMAGLVEMRDPYTAGHQNKVADLAVAIARQLGLIEEQVHALHLAGVVHDLGKIKVPAEILSKPGRLTEIEFSLIKVHPQAGYDILKVIDFPWPIAQMVLQHHERLDGSGYPQGLKGEAILLEARILCVADVVEAMSSHRPYRPGLGIEVALAEITKQRGIYFDPQVVDACVVLFRKQHYSFKS